MPRIQQRPCRYTLVNHAFIRHVSGTSSAIYCWIYVILHRRVATEDIAGGPDCNYRTLTIVEFAQPNA